MRRLHDHRSLILAVAACSVALAACSGASADPVARSVSKVPAHTTPAAAHSTAGAPRAHSSSTAPSAAATPSAASAAPGHRPSGTPITLAFGGDVHFMGVDGVRLASDPSTALGPVAAVLRGADLAMVNLETAVTTRGTPAAKQFVFRAPPSAFTALRDAGVDVATMANNHGMDYGVVGLQDTLAAAHAAHFPVVGIGVDEDAAFAAYRVTIRGQRLAIIGATQVLDDNLAAAWTSAPGKPGLASAKDVARIVSAVRAARADADTVIVYLHWGTEMASCPTAAQRSLSDALVAAGADVIVGSHAHVLLGAGWKSGAFVDYGLGNFVFYAHGGGATSRSGVLELTVAGHAVTAARWVPAEISGGVPQPLSGTAAEAGLAQWQALRQCTGLAATRG